MRTQCTPFVSRISSAGLFVLALGLASSAMAQVREGSTAEADHHMTSAHIAHARDHLRLLHHHAAAHVADATPVDHAIVREHVVAARAQLSAAQQKQLQFESVLTEAERTANRALLDATRVAYTEAETAVAALERELGRAEWRAGVLAEQATAAYHAMRRADEAHQAVGRALGVRDAAAPAAAPVVRAHPAAPSAAHPETTRHRPAAH